MTKIIDKQPFKYLIKISGRYTLNDAFVESNYVDNDKICATVVDDRCILTVLYSIPKNLVGFINEKLGEFLQTDVEAIKFTDIEHFIYETGVRIKHVEIVGCSGKMALSNEELTW